MRPWSISSRTRLPAPAFTRACSTWNWVRSPTSRSISTTNSSVWVKLRELSITITEEFHRVNGNFYRERTWWRLQFRIESWLPLVQRKDTVASKYSTYLIFGAPGSGKGTQGRTLGTIPRLFHCACGDVFRSIDTRTALGKAFLEYSSKGQLVPDEITVELWRVSIELCVDSHRFLPDIDYLILDGIPRNVCQADLMAPFIDVKRVFHLSCPDRNKI